MWQQLGKSILRFRIPLLIILTGITVFMGYRAMHVQLSYDFSRAIPIDNPKYKAYQDFRKNFGDDGNLFVLGIQTEKFFTASLFNDYANLEKDLKKINNVDDIISIPTAINLVRDSTNGALKADSIFFFF